MKSKTMLLIAALLVMSLAYTADAKPNGSLGTDCASCHSDYVPPTDTGNGDTDPGNTDPPTNTNPGDGDTNPGNTDPPTDTEPGDEPDDNTPNEALNYIFGAEFSTIWDYGRLGEEKELDFIFIAIVETDVNVNLVEIETPAGQLLQITNEPAIETENIRTQFYQDEDVFVWRYEIRLADKGELKDFANGNYAIIAHLEDGSVKIKAKYENGKHKARKPKKNKEKKYDDESDDDEQDDEL